MANDKDFLGTELRHKVYATLRERLGEGFGNNGFKWEYWDYKEDIFNAAGDLTEELGFYLTEVTGDGDTSIQASFLSNRGNKFLTCVFDSEVSFVAEDIDEIVETFLSLAEESKKYRELFNLQNVD